MPERRFCCEMNPDEPLAGTADVVDVWVMLEYRPVWRARAVADNALGPATRAWLERNLAALEVAGIRARPQFIRRPEIDTPEIHLMLGVPGRLLEFRGRGYRFLEALDLERIVREPERHPALLEPRYFVCTNGQRDLCCARFGLPAYAALREQVGERAWQVTHLGGHRFAPNMLVLPQGTLYGRVAPDAVPAFVGAVERGELAAGWLRGRTWYPQAVQAAEALTGRSDLRLLHVEGDDARLKVTFAGPAGRVVRCVVRAQDALDVLASCGDQATRPVHPWRAG
jgi:(2Fe-2S) ferredoxin